MFANKIDKILSPSILAYDNCAIADGLAIISNSPAQWVHVDVMDGQFVPNITFGQEMVKGIKRRTKSVIDVHLMTQRPKDLIISFAAAGADIITFHHESSSDTFETIEAIKFCKKKVGLAIKPATPVNEIEKFLPFLDLLLVMSVEPGKCGQTFMPSACEKLRDLSKLKRFLNLDFLISVDGGINSEVFDEVRSCGAEVFVVGSAFFTQTDFFKKAFLS